MCIRLLVDGETYDHLYAIYRGSSGLQIIRPPVLGVTSAHALVFPGRIPSKSMMRSEKYADLVKCGEDLAAALS